ncbi:NUDIX domain-containing protein [Amycolatopsis sp. NPDC059021]|uniref:NUDIX domain-containing protein n=1 Tax=Amycolatopsis sp. NPDC059021 TaxID=3346704 RepID=UPI0036727A46
MMMRVRSVGPRVAAYALLGRDEQLLIRDNGEAGCSLPGTAVRDGDHIEAALCRAIAQQLNVTPSAADFCTVVEHDITLDGHGPATEIAFLFDVTLVDQHTDYDMWPPPFRWSTGHDLTTLQPLAIRTLWRRGQLSVATPWHAWTPSTRS